MLAAPLASLAFPVAGRGGQAIQCRHDRPVDGLLATTHADSVGSGSTGLCCVLGLKRIKGSDKPSQCGVAGAAQAAQANRELGDPRIADPGASSQCAVSTTKPACSLAGGRHECLICHAAKNITVVMLRNDTCERTTIHHAEMNVTLVLRDNVARLMSQYGWTQQGLAKRSGVSQSRIAYLLGYRDKQDRHPTTDTIQRLATALGVSAWQLLCPLDAQPQPPAVNPELLEYALQLAIDLMRDRGEVPQNKRVCAAAALAYPIFAASGSWQAAGASVRDYLASMPAQGASSSKLPPTGGKGNGRSGKGATGRTRKRTA